MGYKTLLVVCCLFAAHAYAQYQPDEVEPGRLQPRPPSRVRLAPQSLGPNGEIGRQGLPVAPRRRPIPAGAFPVPLQGQSNRGRLQLPPLTGSQPAPIPQSYPSTLKPTPVREDSPAQNAIPQPTFSAATLDDILDDDEEDAITPRPSSPSTQPQYLPSQIPRTTAQPPPLAYRIQQVSRPKAPPAFRPEPRNPPLAQDVPVRQSRPQSRPQVSAPIEQRERGPERERAPVSQSVRRYREDRPDGSIVWGFENDDGSFKEEVIGADCIVRGKYGYIDPDGVRREYDYTSGNPCERDEQGRLIPDEYAGDGGQYQQPEVVNDLPLNVKHKARRPHQ
ncbi:hypothetical protein J437_LFUL013704 [Ladona fulva]|uniref:Uncharacterized protein n=1 Tax=Ladona fulva TaxID=123851 RepID=A0A8K0P657_LADFU|nr:hypothetical protein J437_LFUL013704 [Ladona fulva]